MPRGRKGRRNKDDPEKTQDEQSKREWAREINLDVFLPDEGFKKHIQHQCNKLVENLINLIKISFLTMKRYLNEYEMVLENFFGVYLLELKKVWLFFK